MVNKVRLGLDERDLLDSYERGEWKSVAELPKRLRQYQSYAAAALEAEGLVSIVLPKKDLQAIRRKAARSGVSYQMLIADLVHQFVSGRLVEKARA
ncbi:MAG: antitoxin [Planctomycetes bacterium]|nr:antitoxin [Planctomycetota bacterium]